MHILHVEIVVPTCILRNCNDVEYSYVQWRKKKKKKKKATSTEENRNKNLRTKRVSGSSGNGFAS